VRSFASHLLSSGSTRYVEHASTDYRHSAPDQDTRLVSSHHHVHEHPRRVASVGIRKGIESRRASLPTPPTMLHYPRSSRFLRTMPHDKAIMDHPRFFSSIRGLPPRLDHESSTVSQSSTTFAPSVRSSSPHLSRTLLPASTRAVSPRPSYTRALSEAQIITGDIYSVPSSYPAIPPLVFRSSSTWRTSLPDFTRSSSNVALQGVEHARSREHGQSNPFKADYNHEDETDGDDQSESQEESESDAKSDDRGYHIPVSKEQFYDNQRQVGYSRHRFLSAGSSSSATGTESADSLQIVRVDELGPSPVNPSAIITEDRRYPCPHLGKSMSRDDFPNRTTHIQH
jgi:hypothetical protein